MHVPVMLDEVLSLFDRSCGETHLNAGTNSAEPCKRRAPGHAGASVRKVFLDCTVGMGGHSFEILRRFPDVELVGFDLDRDALEQAARRLAPFGGRFHLVHGSFSSDGALGFGDVTSSGSQGAYGSCDSTQMCGDTPVSGMQVGGAPAKDIYVCGVLFDLGVSSYQIDSPERGFSYMQDVALDMRMNRDMDLTAQDIIETYSEKDLARIFWQWGGERLATRFARKIVQARKESAIHTTGDLVRVIQDAIPARKTGIRRGHPAKRVFLALRIEVNAELRKLQEGLNAALQCVGVQGIVAVLSYHSTEDRIVKNRFRRECVEQVPARLPYVPAHLQPQFRSIVRGAQRPRSDEILMNKRAKSARLRAVQRVRAADCGVMEAV